jgi:phospholipase C
MQRNTFRAASAVLLSAAIVANTGPASAAGFNQWNNNRGFGPFADNDGFGGDNWGGFGGGHSQSGTRTPIKHVVVIFNENESFDHYFGIYPNATNPAGEPSFTARSGTPSVNGLTTALLNNNPNLNTANGTGATNPFRLDRSQALTADQGHGYSAEQEAYDDGKADLFPKYTGNAGSGGTGAFNTTGLVMGYYDGNTVTAMWNYAQHFALNDNSYGSQFGPSTPGAINLVSGQTNGVVEYVAGSVTAQQAALSGTSGGVAVSTSTTGSQVSDGQGGYTLMGDSDPTGDTCASTSAATATFTGKNIGDLLNDSNISWGWFQGGFDLTLTNTNGTTGCSRSSTSVTLNNSYQKDYVPHHEPFQYYASTRNLNHTRPSSTAVIGTSNDGGANHQYDTHDFFDAVAAGNLPAVSFLKPPAYENAHPGNSDPLDEQTFVVTVLNTLQKSKFWSDTAVIIAYDDSDGWYDHTTNVINPSTSTKDYLITTGECGPVDGSVTLTAGTVSSRSLPGINGKPVNGRCGYGTRQPLLVISPYAKHNYVDHTLTDQASIIHFIEDNWLNGERIGQGSYDKIAGSLDNMFDFNQKATTTLILDPSLGTVQ